jgi:hypothetical protein
MFYLAPDGRILRQRADRRASVEFERIGEISAERFVAVGRSDGQADLVALRGAGLCSTHVSGVKGRSFSGVALQVFRREMSI